MKKKTVKNPVKREPLARVKKSNHVDGLGKTNVWYKVYIGERWIASFDRESGALSLVRAIKIAAERWFQKRMKYENSKKKK